MLWIIAVLGLFEAASSSTGTPFAEMSMTRIIHNTCDDHRTIVEGIKVRSVLDCARECTEKSDCRRALYCAELSSSSSGLCTLFYDDDDCVMKTNVASANCVCFRKNRGCTLINTCTCPLGFYGNECKDVYTGCKDAFDNGLRLPSDFASVYIKPVTAASPFKVFCNLGGVGRTVILVRHSGCLEENFNRSLADYEQGFGVSRINQWIGFDKLRSITNSDPYRLQLSIQKQDWANCENFYSDFSVSDKSLGYVLNVGTVTASPCGDSISGNISLVGRRFSTYDQDYTGAHRCPNRLGAGWWYADHSDCTEALLTGSMKGTTTNIFWKDHLQGEYIQKVTLYLYI